MDLTRIVALADILGTTAVVVSLIYVAIQIRQNTRATKLATAQNLSKDLRDAYSALYADAEFSRMYLDAMKDIDSLTSEDTFRVYVWTQSYMRALENAYYQYRNGAVDRYVWDAWIANMRFSKDIPTVKSFWRDRQHIFSQEFRDFWNGLPTDDAGVAVAPYDRPGR